MVEDLKDFPCYLKCIFGVFFKLINKIEDASKDRIKIEKNHFDDVKDGVKNYIPETNTSLEKFNEWDELLYLKEIPIEIERFRISKTIKIGCKDFKFLFGIFGFFFCLIHLIGIQAYIIFLKSIYDEIVEDIKLTFTNSPRKYYFFEYLEINTYRKLPEINVLMITSSIGILLLNKCNFLITNSNFQLISLYLFFLLFHLFHFKKIMNY